MFGHQENQTDNNNAASAVHTMDAQPAGSAAGAPGETNAGQGAPALTVSPSLSGHNASSGYLSASPQPVTSPAEAATTPEAAPNPATAPSKSSGPSSPQVSEDNGNLLSLKQSALQQLSPLVDQLDQSPDERFRTLMMLIQASDNQALLQNAYDAAGSITDEKVRAQALLDVVNEINYFTTQQQPQAA
jgi:hypothetical protein